MVKERKKGDVESMCAKVTKPVSITYPPKKYYDNRNTWNLVKTAIVVIFSITFDQVHGYLIGRFRINTKNWTRS